MTEAFADYQPYPLPPETTRPGLTVVPALEITSLDKALEATREGESWVLDYRGCAETGRPPVRRKLGGVVLSVVLD